MLRGRLKTYFAAIGSKAVPSYTAGFWEKRVTKKIKRYKDEEDFFGVDGIE